MLTLGDRKHRTALALNLKKSIKRPRVRIVVEEDNVLYQINSAEIGLGDSSVSAFSCLRQGEEQEL